MTQAYYILEQTLPFKTLEQTHSSEIELKSVEKKADRDLQTLLQEEKTTPDDVADYLVKGLKQSQQTHPRYQEAMQFLSTQKYQPRYTMVFRLVARLTSADKNGDQPLRSFWKALLSKPFDITGIGH